MDGDGDRDRDRRVVEAVAVDMVGEAPGALGPAGDGAAGQPLGIVDQRLEIGMGLGDAVAVEQPDEGALADPAGGELGLQVAFDQQGQPDIDGDQPEQRAVGHAPLIELGRRDTQAFLEDLGRIAGEDRLDHEDVGQVHAAVIGIVEDDDVAGMEVTGELRQHHRHRVGHGAEMQRHRLGLGDDAALRVAQGGRIIEHVANDRRAGGPHHRVRHLVDDRIERALDHREGDRIEIVAAGVAHRRSSRMLPSRSDRALQPGGTTTVLS